jgi:predicted dithiol-disulfide oxidoreductase (DUF899 family)
VTPASELGPWAPLEVETTVEVLDGVPFLWWLGGGRALELHLGRSWRGHDDTDVGVLRRQLDAVWAALSGWGWQVAVAAAGQLRPWGGEPLDPDRHENNLWCRREGGNWQLDLTIGEGDETTWVFRRDPRIRWPMEEAVLRTADGVPYLAPELQLLFKSEAPRQKDDVDAREVIPELDPTRRARLADLLPGDHPWEQLLGATPMSLDPGRRLTDETETAEDTMTTTSGKASSDLPGKPPVVDRATWQAARDELLVREKAHTRESDAIAAARRRLPMVEVDGTAEVTGADGPVRFVDLFQGRDELVVYHSMWYDGAPSQGQCEGCTFNVWQMDDAVYLNARGVSFAVLTSGAWDEVAPYVDFMGYTQPWYSVRGVEESVGAEEGHIICFLREGDRVFLTYSTTGRGNEPADGALGLLDMTPYGRREGWEDNPDGWPEAPDAGSPAGGHGAPICWYWRADGDGHASWGPTSRPTPQWTRPGATPEQTLGRQGDHH